jgi:hypothetical protein
MAITGRAFGFVAWLAAGAALAQAQEPAFPCGAADKECAFKALREHRVKQVSFWNDSFKGPIEDRIAPAPPALVEALTLDVIAHGYPNHPRAAAVEDDFRADLRQAIAELPQAVKRRLDEKLAGIFLMEDFGGSGFSDAVRNARGSPVAAYVVLDPSVLRKQTANGWATWKENTPFKADAAFTLEATIERASDDNRKQAMQYILLHEFAHVLSTGATFHPDWNLAPANVPQKERYPFFDYSWFIDRGRNRYETHFDRVFPERVDVVYYFGAKLPASAMPSVYSSLERTNFPTLYAVTRPGDDFAESFASYVHTVMMDKPFEIRILEKGRVVKRFTACWSDERCAEKRRILEAFLR